MIRNKEELQKMTTVEVLEMIVKELDSLERTVDISDPSDTATEYNFGLYSAISVVQGLLELLTTEVAGENVLFQYRGRQIRINKDKFTKYPLKRVDIDQYLINEADKTGLDPFNIDMEEIASRYTLERIEEIVDMYLDREIKVRGLDKPRNEREEEDFDEEAFRKYCEDVAERYFKWQAGDDELPVTDSSRKLAIWLEVLDEFDEKGNKKAYNGAPITLEERIERSNKRFEPPGGTKKFTVY